MSQHTQKLAIAGLRWTLGIVVLLEAIRFTFARFALHHFAQTGHPPWMRLILGGGEIVGAVLFLAPAANLAGGCLLVFTFALAAVLHLVNGEFEVGRLIVYAMAAFVCVMHRDRK